MNGRKWQVHVVKGELRKYVGAIEHDYIAALIYDKYALIIQGFQVSDGNRAFV